MPSGIPPNGSSKPFPSPLMPAGKLIARPSAPVKVMVRIMALFELLTRTASRAGFGASNKRGCVSSPIPVLPPISSRSTGSKPRVPFQVLAVRPITVLSCTVVPAVTTGWCRMIESVAKPMLTDSRSAGADRPGSAPIRSRPPHRLCRAAARSDKRGCKDWCSPQRDSRS